jgi:predicted RNase H-like HicB family nuclease
MKRLNGTFDISLRVVFYKEDSHWIAHCLEFDLLGDGRTKEKALESLTEAIGLQLEESFKHNNSGNLFSPAPSEAWEMFALGKDTAVGNLSVCIEHLASKRAQPYSLGEIRLRAYEGAKRIAACELV